MARKSSLIKRKGPCPRKPDHPMYGISRIDNDSTHCWYVRIKTTEGLLPASFSDRKYGDKRKALAAAKQWRDDHVPSHSERPALNSWGPLPSLTHARNKTGMARVAIIQKYNSDGEITSIIWEARWREPHPEREKGSLRSIIKTKSFAVKRYGYRAAYLWACKTRAEKLGKKANLKKLTPPPPPKYMLLWLKSHEVNLST